VLATTDLSRRLHNQTRASLCSHKRAACRLLRECIARRCRVRSTNAQGVLTRSITGRSTVLPLGGIFVLITLVAIPAYTISSPGKIPLLRYVHTKRSRRKARFPAASAGILLHWSKILDAKLLHCRAAAQLAKRISSPFPHKIDISYFLRSGVFLHHLFYSFIFIS
jgi:hypothetical protein